VRKLSLTSERVTVITPAAAAPKTAALPSSLRLGPVHLVVTQLERSIPFYTEVLGLRIHERAGSDATLGDGNDPVIVLEEDATAGRAGRHAGLYHVALLYPSRLELARVALRLAASRTSIQGASDHGTHEAIYLPDPDGNGLELAADRPQKMWPSYDEEFSRGGPRPLDTDDLFGLVAGEQPSSGPVDGLRVGHVHLHVGNLGDATSFYRDVLGFDLMFAMPSASFLSVGGYHHHIAVNTWQGEGAAPAPAGTVGLDHLTLVLPSEADVEAVRSRLEGERWSYDGRRDGLLARDPSGNAVAVVRED
jgi:catechol 2,3-dioxygenase